MNNYCDRCGAAGLARFVKDNGEGEEDLIFCGHHSREYSPGLEAAGFVEDAILEEALTTLVTA